MTRITQRWPRLSDDLIRVAPAWITTRVLVVAGYVLAAVASDTLLDRRTLELDNGLLAWDGRWYERIAQHGYQDQFIEGVRFFPLYPLLGKIASFLFAGNEAVALVVLANACSLGFTITLRRLVVHETADQRLADRVVWVSAVFPAAFVSVWAYSETLMLWLVAAGLLAARQRRWAAAAALGLLAGVSRPIGMVLSLAVLPDVIAGWRAAAGRDRAWRLAALASAPASAGAFVLWASIRFDDFLIPFTIQDDIRGENPNPIGRLIDGVRDMFGAERFADGLHVPFAFLFVVLVVVVFWRLPLGYGLLSLAVVVVALAAETLNSLERYGMNAFPLLIGLAMITRDERLDRPALTIAAAGCTSLAALAWLGAYVP